MDATTIAALTAGLAGIITAVTALITTLQHRADPAAHDGQGHQGAGSG
jgi:L-serine deaminase